MTKTIKTMGILLVIILLQVLISCNEEKVQKLCLQPPCGTVDESQTNLTILVTGGVVPTEASLSIDDEEITLTLDGLDLDEHQQFTCWQTIPEITSSSVVILGYVLGGDVVIGSLNSSFISKNELVITIDGDAAALTDYEECIDLI